MSDWSSGKDRFWDAIFNIFLFIVGVILTLVILILLLGALL